MQSDPHVYICCRDRVTPLRELVAWLERAGHQRIVLLDNASTYPPLLEFYESTPHEVRRLGFNYGSRALWALGTVPTQPFVYTDPDVIPTEDCPLDAVAHLSELLDRHATPKVGLGLYLDDVPADMPSLGWERELVSDDREIAPGVYSSLVDTTFALYRGGAPFAYEGLRTGAPYQARHVSWYVGADGTGAELSDEDRYYLERATPGPLGSSWAEYRKG